LPPLELRRDTFGTIKMRLGATHFLMKRLKNVKTEMALSVLAYNLTRIMNILGSGEPNRHQNPALSVVTENCLPCRRVFTQPRPETDVGRFKFRHTSSGGEIIFLRCGMRDCTSTWPQITPMSSRGTRCPR